MIAFIEGQVFLVENGYAVIKPGGVGYQVSLCKRDLERIIVGEVASLYVHTHVREDAIELYGFLTMLERQVFLLLISVSGVGPKLALAILSSLAPSDILSAIINKDVAVLSGVSGIGKKTAERLSLELKDKAMKIDFSPVLHSEQSVRTNLEQAIRSLGYSKSQSDKALLSLDQADWSALPLEGLIKKTLNVLSGSKS